MLPEAAETDPWNRIIILRYNSSTCHNHTTRIPSEVKRQLQPIERFQSPVLLASCHLDSFLRAANWNICKSFRAEGTRGICLIVSVTHGSGPREEARRSSSSLNVQFGLVLHLDGRRELARCILRDSWAMNFRSLD